MESMSTKDYRKSEKAALRCFESWTFQEFADTPKKSSLLKSVVVVVLIFLKSEP